MKNASKYLCALLALIMLATCLGGCLNDDEITADDGSVTNYDDLAEIEDEEENLETGVSVMNAPASSAAPVPTPASSAAPAPTPASSAAPAPTPASPAAPVPLPQGRVVYRTPYGKRYHYDSDCGGKNSYAIVLDQAKEQGLTPCQKCVHD